MKGNVKAPPTPSNLVNLLALVIAALTLFGMWNWSHPPITAFDTLRDLHILHPGGRLIMYHAAFITLAVVATLLILNWMFDTMVDGRKR